MAIWTTELDYIYFFYGLAFILLGAACLSVQRDERQPLPWLSFGMFGFSHGVNEWLDLFAITMGTSPYFDLVRVALLTLSFTFLLQACRLIIWSGQRDRISYWVIIPAALAPIMVSVYGDTALVNGLVRYLLGLPGCLGLALLLARHSRGMTLPEDRRSALWLRMIAAIFALYGLSSGLVAPASALPLSQLINPAWFLASFGVPIQLVRGVLAVATTAVLWRYEVERLNSSDTVHKLGRHVWITIGCLVVVVGSGDALTNGLHRLFAEELQDDIAADLSLLSNIISHEVATTNGAVQSMAAEAADASGQAAANLLTDRVSQATGDSLAYLIGLDGIVTAASNRNEPTSLVGQNFSYRPYFKAAASGQPGHYFAMGAVTHEAGYYASAPVRSLPGGAITAVAVIKKPLTAQGLGLSSLEEAHLVDANGIVLFGSRPQLQLRALWPLSAETRQRIVESRQFDRADFRPLFSQEPANMTPVKMEDTPFLAGRQWINEEGWSVLLLREQTPVIIARLFGIVVTLLVCCLVITHYVIFKRQLNAETEINLKKRELEQLSATLEAAWQRAETATRTKSAFLANMSHELRTPMNAVIGLSQMTLKTTLLPRQRDYLTKILTSATGLLDIINDILDLSKIEAGKLSLEAVPFSLSAVLDNLATVTSLRTAEKRLELLFQVDPQVPQNLVGDPLRLGQVLLNLVNNAIKFTERGEVVLSIQLQQQQPEEVKLLFTVRDTGIGITSEQKEHLFQAFSQADSTITRRYGGTGLGLVICKQICELMGGYIQVDSEPGRGSTFSFTAILGLDSGQVPGPGAEQAAALSGLRALVVDDNAVAREILADTLASWPIAVSTATSGLEAVAAVDRASKSGQPFDFVLMDWQMPGVDGIEACRRIKNDPDLPLPPAIFMITALDQEDLRLQCESLSVAAILTKPVESSKLLDTIATVFAPATRLQPARAAAAATLLPPKLQGARVLLAEDNEINQMIAVALLNELGIEVEVAANGQLAVVMAIAGVGRYDAILMDVQMPDMDGLEATRRIIRRLGARRPPIIAMTAHALVEERQRCLEAGMDDHLAKPVDPRALARTLERWVQPQVKAPPAAKRPTSEPLLGPTAAAATLPKTLPPFNLDEALRRLDDNAAVLTKAIIAFRRTYETSSTIPELEQMIDRGAFDDAHRFAHSLKGIAATLSAQELAEAAEALEIALAPALQTTIDNAKLAPLISLLGRQLSIAVAAAATVEAAAAEPVANGNSPPEEVSSVTARAAALKQLPVLQGRLATNSPLALEQVATLRSMLGGAELAPYLNALTRHLEHADFRAAEAVLAALSATLTDSRGAA